MNYYEFPICLDTKDTNEIIKAGSRSPRYLAESIWKIPLPPNALRSSGGWRKNWIFRFSMTANTERRFRHSRHGFTVNRTDERKEWRTDLSPHTCKSKY